MSSTRTNEYDSFFFLHDKVSDPYTYLICSCFKIIIFYMQFYYAFYNIDVIDGRWGFLDKNITQSEHML